MSVSSPHALQKPTERALTMTNLAISNVEFTFTTSDKFQELINAGYSPKVIGVNAELKAPNQPLSDAEMRVRFNETGDLFTIPLINYSWAAHLALSTYILTPNEAFQEIVFGKEGVATLNDVAYSVPNPTESK